MLNIVNFFLILPKFTATLSPKGLGKKVGNKCSTRYLNIALNSNKSSLSNAFPSTLFMNCDRLFRKFPSINPRTLLTSAKIQKCKKKLHYSRFEQKTSAFLAAKSTMRLKRSDTSFLDLITAFPMLKEFKGTWQVLRLKTTSRSCCHWPNKGVTTPKQSSMSTSTYRTPFIFSKWGE